MDRAAQRFRYVYNTYLSGTDTKVYLSVIPDKGYFMAPSSGRPSMDYDALVSRLREGTAEMTYIDLFDRLTLEDYYRADAHWRQERLPAVARYLAGAMGADAAADYTEVTLDRPFYGVYSGYAALPWPGRPCAISPTTPSPPAGSPIMRPAGKARCTTWKRPGAATRMSCFCPGPCPC